MSNDPMAQDVPWDDYPMRRSADPAKRDMELIHDACGEHLCDVEHGDTLPVLAGVVTDHDAACPHSRTMR
ncbi:MULTISPECIES: hypothetical protein [Streptomyces]|nr:hypothetical protein [Streptomyces sp. F12]